MSLDENSQAARVFWRLVSTFSQTVKPWQAAIYYDTKPDETWDLTLVSRRVYGRSDEFLAVMAAAGIDSLDYPLAQRRLVLPTEETLRQFKLEAGFESRAIYREAGKPTWSTD